MNRKSLLFLCLILCLLAPPFIIKGIYATGDGYLCQR